MQPAKVHHVRHHHVEDNGPKDLSSTMRYQRDSVWDFVCYFSRFFFFSWIELPLYFFNQGKLFYAALNFVSEISFFSFYALGLKNAPSPAGFFCVFLLPFILVRFGMMSGNWAQHAFVDASDPTNNYRSSITCIEVPYNAIAFNDGYHTSHHLNSIRHWQDHPEYIAKNRDKFKAEKAIIFQGIDFHQTWLFLMMKDYSSLAKHLLQLTHPGEPGHLSEEEIILFLKSRTRAMTRKEIEAGYPSLKKKL